MTSIGNKASNGCSGLTDVYNLATTPQSIAKNVFSNYTATLHVPTGCKEVYAAATGWKNFTNIVEESTGIKSLQQGRHVANPQKGGIYIRGSRKVLMK